MQFFETLLPLTAGAKEVRFTITQQDGVATVVFFPQFANDAINDALLPLRLKGTGAEIDAAFFDGIQKQVNTATGLQTNLQQVVAQVEEKAPEIIKQAQADAEKPKGKSKAPAAKPVAKAIKPVAKTAAPKSEGQSKPAFMENQVPSEALAAIVGPGPMSRTEVTKLVWEYIKKHNLKDPKEKRNIKADEALEKVFGKKVVTMFEMAKHINSNLTTLPKGTATKTKTAAPATESNVEEQAVEGTTEEQELEASQLMDEKIEAETQATATITEQPNGQFAETFF